MMWNRKNGSVWNQRGAAVPSRRSTAMRVPSSGRQASTGPPRLAASPSITTGQSTNTTCAGVAAKSCTITGTGTSIGTCRTTAPAASMAVKSRCGACGP